MTEIEPVGYAMKVDGKFKGLFEEGSKLLVPLYTKEQLQPRVKMTRAEFDEFNILKKHHSTEDLISILRVVNGGKYINLQSRLVCSIENQVEFANLWQSCLYERPEETIEVLPDNKWFVRSKEADEDGDWLFLSNISKNKFNDRYCYSRDKKGVLSINSHAFDTKEEAEKWCNPLCEAVLLPVEEK